MTTDTWYYCTFPGKKWSTAWDWAKDNYGDPDSTTWLYDKYIRSIMNDDTAVFKFRDPEQATLFALRWV